MIPIETPEDEVTTNFRFLEHIPKRRVRAISYYDEAFWESEQGRNFLECNRRIATAGIAITRIFVIRGELNARIKKLMADQMASGVIVHHVSEEELRRLRYQAEDFVIYDDTAVRTADLANRDNPTTPHPDKDKIAKLKITAEVQHYANRFDAILSHSTKFSNSEA